MSKIRNLPEATSVIDNDLLYVVDSTVGANGGKKVKISTLKDNITAAEIKTKYESNPDTNAFDDAEKAKLNGIETGATADQIASEVPYDNSSSGLVATNVQAAIDEASTEAQADFRPSVVSGRILHYTGGTARFDGIFYQLVAGDILLNPSVTDGEVYVDLDGIVKQTASSTLAPPFTVVFAKFTTDLNDITSLTDERVKNAQNIVRGIVGDVRDVRAGAAASAGASGRVSDAMHKHPILTAAPVTQTPDQANTEGTAIELARADHLHDIPADAPTTTLSPATTNAEGTGTAFSRNDHTHAVATAAVGVITTIQPDASAAAGTDNTYARGDHRHAIVADAPTTTLSPATSNAEGTGTSFARNDHTHAVATALVGDITTIQPDDAAAAGTANTYARGDHKHAIVAATASSISTSTTNTEGSSTSFARADHTHVVTITNSEATATADDTTTSVTDVLMVSMTLTPASGTYFVMWSGSIVNSANGAERTFVSLYLNGSQVAATERSIGTSGAAYSPAMTHAVITTPGSQAIELRWRVAAGTSTVHSRRLSLAKIG